MGITHHEAISVYGSGGLSFGKKNQEVRVMDCSGNFTSAVMALGMLRVDGGTVNISGGLYTSISTKLSSIVSVHACPGMAGSCIATTLVTFSGGAFDLAARNFSGVVTVSGQVSWMAAGF